MGVESPPEAIEPAVERDVVLGEGVETSGPKQPLARRAVAEPSLLPLSTSAGTASVRIVGTHGGAGGSTLAELLGEALAEDAGHIWPRPQIWVPESATGSVLLLARTHHSGLESLREVLTSWHAGAYDEGLPLLGVCLVDDAPHLVKAQITEIKALTAMSPRGWHVPWQESLRIAPPSEVAVPARIRWTLSRIRHHATHRGTHQKKENS
ncbi:DUF6668 family protein [Brachybacterium sp. J144]|uniref:DUF6668 family protein n=1 Tax=Brachybacterium sp. J144 TaxID=3116487 RepID=UPI002E7716B6|nr:DUF6668 family protein [Brachybacterium sp. J144]MEE1652169.1 DUF6668 family protein [Brachybacterium sp. J144]